MNMRHLKGSALVALLVAAAPLAAQGVSVQLSGLVSDANGQALAQATVTIRNDETGYTRVVQTADNGRYLAVNLPTGPYSVTVTKSGFQTANNLKVTLNLGDAAPLNVKLAPESSTTVEIVATPVSVDSERSTQATIINPDALQNLPANNRSFTSLATATPQVVIDNQRGNLAIAGQRGVNTSIQVDGGDLDEPFFGGATGAAEGATPFTISIEVVKEYQVVTDGASAEFGRMGGGYVNAITKSGTNEFDGSVFYYTRPQAWIANEPWLKGANGKSSQALIADYSQKQFGFTVGGPIVKDKLFYFVGYDAQRKTNPITQVWGGVANPYTPNPGAHANEQALVDFGGDYDTKNDSNVFFGRLDWILNESQTLQFRLNASKYDGTVGAGPTASVTNTASDVVKTLQGTVQWNWNINSNLMNEASVYYVKDELPRVSDSTIPQVQVGSGPTTIGFYGAYPFERQFQTKRYEVKDNLTYVTATSVLRGGVDYNRTDVAETFASFYRGGYRFNNITAFDNGQWATYQQFFGLGGLTAEQAGTFAATEKEMAAYIQFDQRASEYLKYGLGLRWDRQEHPGFSILDFSNPMATSLPLDKTIPTDSSFSPRFSLTWTPEGDGSKTVVRLNGGRYVSRTPSVFLYQAFAVNSYRGASITFGPGQAALYGIPFGPSFNAENPFVFTSYPTGATPAAQNVFSFDQDFKNPRTDRLSLGADRALGSWVLGIEWAAAHTVNLERLHDLNLGTPTPNAYGREIFPAARPNTHYRQIMAYTSDAQSWYHALTLSAKYHKEGSPFDLQLFYTRSTNKDNDSNERNFSSYSEQNTQNLGADWAYADTDRRSVATGSINYIERHTGIQLGAVVKYLSGSPYTLTYGSDLNRDGITGNDRYYVNGQDSGRNSFRNGAYTNVDLRIQKTFQFTQKLGLTLSADAFNAFNDHNKYSYQTLPGTPLTPSTDGAPYLVSAESVINQPGQPYSGRSVQVGAKFSF